MTPRFLALPRLAGAVAAAVAAAITIAQPLAAQPAAPTDDPRWAESAAYYRAGRNDEGHRLLISLADQSPGRLDLAVACYESILRKEGLSTPGNPWILLAAERLLSLERLGAVSANTRILRGATESLVTQQLTDGRLLEARQTVDRLHAENPHDLHWRILRARTYARLDLREARPLLESLRPDLDLDHPEPQARALWTQVELELRNLDPLPAPIPPPLTGSPLPFTAPEDPDGHWREIMDQSPAAEPAEFDRLLAMSLDAGQSLPWRDGPGFLDASFALDLHLSTLPPDDLLPLRDTQEQSFARQPIPDDPTPADLLRLYRRFPWALSAQQLLLRHASAALWDGRPHAARRSFEDLLAHAIDPNLRDLAQVGLWTTLGLTGDAAELHASAAAVDPGKAFPWMGKTATATEIRDLLMPPASAPAPAAPLLRDLSTHPLLLPPVAPWSADSPAPTVHLDLQADDSHVLASARNLLVCFDANPPCTLRWSQLHPHPLEDNRKSGYHPGLFRPLLVDGTLFTRWGYSSLPSGFAAFDLADGRPLWAHLDQYSSGPARQPNRPLYSVPTGDPVLAGHSLLSLQWASAQDIADRNGRSLKLVSLDPIHRKEQWSSTIAASGQGPGLLTIFEDAEAQKAIYGNPVTVHRNAIFCNSNAGLIARCDPRDGRVEWLHSYRRTNANPPIVNLGCSPLPVGEALICLPRDTNRIFALDQHTGRLLWDNPLLLPLEVLGVVDDLVLVRGADALLALDAANGEPRWSRPLPPNLLCRALLLSGSAYIGTADSLLRFDARSGELLESRPWDLGADRPVAFTINRNRLYVVTDRPSAPLPPPSLASQTSPALSTLPFRPAWTLSRPDARIFIPPPEAGMPDTALVQSGSILESIDLGPSGAIRWQHFLGSPLATVSFAPDTVLLAEPPAIARSGVRLRGLDPRTGAHRWESAFPASLDSRLPLGDKFLYHDRRSSLLLFDARTGQIVWQRRFSEANLFLPFWDGQRLHLLHFALPDGPLHILLDPADGRTIAHSPIVTRPGLDRSNDAQPVADGFYELRFAPTPARFVRLTSLSDYSGRGWASASELLILDAEGNPLPHDKWSIDAPYERLASPRALPVNLIDNNPESWWHTPWIESVPVHPHHITIDLGSRQNISGLRYLPARIINNNGLIRDYELRLRDDQADWPNPVAQGILVNQTRIDRAVFAQGALYFEARDFPSTETGSFRLALGPNDAPVTAPAPAPGATSLPAPVPASALPAEPRARLHSTSGPYLLLVARDPNGQESLVVRRADDPAWRFDLSPHLTPARQAEIAFLGDRLVTTQNQFVLADLVNRTFLAVQAPPNSPVLLGGPLFRLGPHHLLKLVTHENIQIVALIDLRNGQLTESPLPANLSPFQAGAFALSPDHTLPYFDRTILHYDQSNLRAWIPTSPP